MIHYHTELNNCKHMNNNCCIRYPIQERSQLLGHRTVSRHQMKAYTTFETENPATFLFGKCSRHFQNEKCVHIIIIYFAAVFSPGYICTSQSLGKAIIEYTCLNVMSYCTVRILFKAFMLIYTNSSFGTCVHIIIFFSQMFSIQDGFEPGIHCIIKFLNIWVIISCGSALFVYYSKYL